MQKQMESYCVTSVGNGVGFIPRTAAFPANPTLPSQAVRHARAGSPGSQVAGSIWSV